MHANKDLHENGVGNGVENGGMENGMENGMGIAHLKDGRSGFHELQ